MNLTKQGALLSIILLAGCASTEVKKEQPKILSLNDAQIKTVLVGKTMVANINGNTYVGVYSADGSVKGDLRGESDQGTYSIENGLYCSKWKRWANSKKTCWSFSKRAKDYFAKPVSGRGSPFTFIVK